MAVDLPTRTSETTRVEAFSDAVFAIALTLLVLDLRPPAAGAFVEGLLDDWPAYLAYLAAFLTIASIWLSHHNAFTRVRRADPAVLVVNLMLLLGASLVPWPTALLAAAIGSGRYADEVAAILVYVLVSVIVAVSWTLLGTTLLRRPHLLVAPADRHWVRRNVRNSAGGGIVAVVGGAIGFLSPVVALLIFFAVPLAFFVVELRSKETPGAADVDAA